jgi:uncharacterized circularly permuted ATP-grasp superfamily protein/uncharacterized alpha-E superfamily protein
MTKWETITERLRGWTRPKLPVVSEASPTATHPTGLDLAGACENEGLRGSTMSSTPKPGGPPQFQLQDQPSSWGSPASALPDIEDLAAAYHRDGGGFDELRGVAGSVQPHWLPLLDALGALSPTERLERVSRLNMRVRETGIAHDLFADPTNTAQPWRIDFVPLVIPPADWRVLERALVQRARLFEAILADVYGPQRLMASGHIPPGLIFSDPSFLRACHGIATGSGHLQFFATDIARGPDGRWRVIDTHAETPAGIGYALANRMVHTRVTDEMFNACNALRLAPFFQALQSALSRRVNRADPSIALLTPGPHHNDFFSHAYLARYLGFLLVEGGDLRVVGGQVYLKTLEGLKPIDLIVRCVAGHAADPLELDANGFLGPVGLVQAVRRQPNLVVNALGAAVAENRGLGPYLPGLARTLLGEDLLIPDGPKWWLGEAAARAHVVANLDQYVIRSAHEDTARPGRAVPGRDPTRMSAGDRSQLIAEIERSGTALVAEEKIGFGTTPSLTPHGLVAKPFALRLFVAMTPDGPIVMPGGLAMTVDPSAAVALSAPNGESRDVWVVSDGAIPPFASLWKPTIEAAQIQRSPRELPSRAADNLFWLGRYVERADWTLRVLRHALGRLEGDATGPRHELAAARKAMETLLDKDAGRRAANLNTAPPVATGAVLIRNLAKELMTSPERTFGLPQTLGQVRGIASLVRDRLSQEAWRTLNTFHLLPGWQASAAPQTLGDTLDLLDAGIGALAAFNGLMHENMTRNFGWSFLDMGRRLSRALNLADVMLGVFGAAEDENVEAGSLLFVLELGDSFITYRSRYRLTPILPLVLDLLLTDETNPRSLAYQLAALSQHIDQLPRGGQQRIEESRLLLSLLTQVRVSNANELARSATDGTRPRLETLLSEQLAILPQLSEALGRRYFALIDKEPRWTRAGVRSEG